MLKFQQKKGKTNHKFAYIIKMLNHIFYIFYSFGQSLLEVQGVYDDEKGCDIVIN